MGLVMRGVKTFKISQNEINKQLFFNYCLVKPQTSAAEEIRETMLWQ
jgi:hypothetical protein